MDAQLFIDSPKVPYLERFSALAPPDSSSQEVIIVWLSVK